MSGQNGLTATLFAEILRDSHAYAAGIDPRRPTLVSDPRPLWRRNAARARERVRNSLERVASRAGFSHSHIDPGRAGTRLARLAELSEGLESTYAQLGDEASRRALVDVLKLRVLGPYHARLAITPEGFRAEQARVDREHRLEADTFTVSDPWFSPLSRYRVPVGANGGVELHAHSVDLVSVYVHEQYGYGRGAASVRAAPGDIVFDVGGCWGDTALYFASLVGPQGKVFTFEFDPESLEILRANLALNPELAGRIEVVERALWDTSGDTLQFDQAGRCTMVRAGSGSGSAGAGGSRVTTMTLDDFVAEAGLERVDFVKMDVEGVELNVLAGAQGTLVRHAPKLAIAAYHKDDDLVTIPRAIPAIEAGYRFYLGSFSPVEDETVLFARATERSSST